MKDRGSVVSSGEVEGTIVNPLGEKAEVEGTLCAILEGLKAEISALLKDVDEDSACTVIECQLGIVF